MYKIISNVVPLSLSGPLNQIWKVCGMLLLFQAPIINQETRKCRRLIMLLMSKILTIYFIFIFIFIIVIIIVVIVIIIAIVIVYIIIVIIQAPKQLPTADDDEHLANKFADFFHSKISMISKDLDQMKGTTTNDYSETSQTDCQSRLSNFQLIS